MILYYINVTRRLDCALTSPPVAEYVAAVRASVVEWWLCFRTANVNVNRWVALIVNWHWNGVR